MVRFHVAVLGGADEDPERPVRGRYPPRLDRCARRSGRQDVQTMTWPRRVPSPETTLAT
jgi:hypothetical protein